MIYEKQTLIRASICVSQQLVHLRGSVEAYQIVKDNSSFPALIGNSLILSFAVHFRNIFDFLYTSNLNQKDDVIAEHFFDSSKDWLSLRPPQSAVLITSRKRLNKHLAHITYERVNQTSEDRFWDFQAILEALAPAINAFIHNVDKSKLHSDLFDELSHRTWIRFMNDKR